MSILVQKFGGTSVETPEKIKAVAQRVAESRKQCDALVVVVSAMGHTTDELIHLAHQVSPHPVEREYDALISTGENVSSALLAMALNDLGCPAISLSGQQVGMVTQDSHVKARIIDIKTDRLKKELNAGKVVVVAGFQGINSHNDITTIGRGGSDTTAVALAAALKAPVCEIFTDVRGVFTADPRLVPEARKIPVLSYEEMLEKASLGALVLHPRCVEAAKNYGIVIHVRSAHHPEEGTLIKEVEKVENKKSVSGVAHDTNVAKITILQVPDKPGMAAKIFGGLAAAKINVDMIIQSEHQRQTNDITFTVTKVDAEKALSILKTVNDEIGGGGVASDPHVAKVSIVGVGMISQSGVAAAMFEALAAENINIELISTSEIKISCVVAEKEAAKAVRALHKKFELDK